MEGWLDLVNASGAQLMVAPAKITTTTTLTIANDLNYQQRFMRMGRNWAMEDTGITITGHVKYTGVNDGSSEIY